MLGKLFGARAPAPKSGPQFVPMQAIHLGRVKEIIEQTDEDDAEEAAESIRERFCEGMFVVEDDGEILGVTGSFTPDDSDGVAWLSWTYVDEASRGKGIGKFMVNELLTVLHQQQVRKLFIATSDYTEDGEDVYGDARRFYASMGATQELQVPGYHSADESKIVFGMANPEVTHPPLEMGEPPTGINFDRTGPAPESDSGLALFWSDAQSGVNGLDRLVSRSRHDGVRTLLAVLPHDYSAIASSELTRSGFIEHGQLTDYYATDLHQVWWSLKLTD
ncbi:MAG: GNAT family N-acetyltransferase [Burkholderiaceae bacterium]